MAFINWNDNLSVGVTLFDNDHRELIRLANELHDSISVGSQSSVLLRILDELVKYTIYHFAHEEGMMLQYSYPGYVKHREEHEALIKKVEDFQHQAMSGKTAISLSLIGFLKEWLVNHIMKSDMEYRTFFNGKGIK